MSLSEQKYLNGVELSSSSSPCVSLCLSVLQSFAFPPSCPFQLSTIREEGSKKWMEERKKPGKLLEV